MIEAVVQTNGSETVYRRAGSGRPVLLLVRDAALRDRLLSDLSGGCRVVAPVMPPEVADAASGPARGEVGGGPGADGDAPFGAWLRGVIDGLGLSAPALVAGPELAPAVLAFAVADPDRAERVVVLGGPAAGAVPTRHPLIQIVGVRQAQDGGGDGVRPAAEPRSADDDPSATLAALRAFLGGPSGCGGGPTRP